MNLERSLNSFEDLRTYSREDSNLPVDLKDEFSLKYNFGK